MTIKLDNPKDIVEVDGKTLTVQEIIYATRVYEREKINRNESMKRLRQRRKKEKEEQNKLK